MHNVEVVLPPTLNINFKFDHYNNFGENVLDSGQHYYVEDGHIIYDNAPTDVDATTIAFYNGSSSGSNRRQNSSGNASSDERLPSSRWSPATASTTITVADDNDFSSSKHQLIMPSSLPKMKSKCPSDGNSVKSEEDEVLEVVPPTEPVLPFFSLPATPTITSVPTTGNTTTAALCGSVARSSNGYQSAGNSGYQSTGNGYQSSSKGYQSNAKGYQSSAKGYQSSAIGYQSSAKGYQSSVCGYRTSGNGYQGSNICQDVSKNRLVGDSRGDSIVAPATVISCFVGDQRQSNDKNLRRCGGDNSSPTVDGGKEFVFPAVESIIDENRSHHEQKSELLPCRLDNKQQSPLLQSPQQQNRHDGYCGKQMMIAAAAVAGVATNNLGSVNGCETTTPSQQQQLPLPPLPSTPPQQQKRLQSPPPPPPPSPAQQQPTTATLLASSTAYVMLDMVTAAAEKKRLLHMGGGRIDYGKPVVVVHQPVVSVDASCATSTAQV